MKRLSALICLVLALVLCLTACADKSETQENTTEVTEATAEATTEATRATAAPYTTTAYQKIDNGDGTAFLFYGTYTDTWEQNTNGVLILYENFEMENYEYGTAPWYNDRAFVYSVEIRCDIDFIGDHAFYLLTNLTSIEIPDGVTSIGDGAFGACRSLTEITIPDSVTFMDWSVFAGCESLVSVTLPNSITVIPNSAFGSCESLTDIVIPDNVTTIENSAFAHCYSLESITIPAGVTELGDYVFSQCTSLTGITVDENNPSYADVDGVLFDKDVTELICYPLGKTDTDYEIPDGVTTIDMNAFEKNETLESITIPKSVTFIGQFAFCQCPNLTDIYYEGTEAEWNEITLEKYYDYQSEFKVHFLSE